MKSIRTQRAGRGTQRKSGNQRPSRHGKQIVRAATQSVAIIGAAKMSASLDNERLAIRVLNGFVTLRPKLEEWLPLAIELRSRFETLRKERKGATILDCGTWEQFCKEKLGYSDRHVRRLMAANPATDIYARDLTDDEYFKKGVRAVHSVLRPLKSDPLRIIGIAKKIAAQIREDFFCEDDDDLGWAPGEEQ